jgi:methylated-DNA-[protein]-cysteine S-methyltransferase
MKLDKDMPGVAKTLLTMHAQEKIPPSSRRAQIRAHLLESASPISLCSIETKLGWIAVAYSANGIVALDFPRTTRTASVRGLRCDYAEAKLEDAPSQVVKELREYAQGHCRKFDVSIDWAAIKPFQRAVLQAAFSIPFGETRTYAWIAQKIGKPRAVRAVGHALGTNPIPIVLPCHRVIGSDGGLRGYRGGLELKARLLKLEGVKLG